MNSALQSSMRSSAVEELSSINATAGLPCSASSETFRKLRSVPIVG